MHALATVFGVIVVLIVLLDAFETVVLPRRIRRVIRLSSWFYRNTWRPWVKLARRIRSGTRQENFLGYFGPLSLLFLLGLWAIGLIMGFALMQYGSGDHIHLNNRPVSFHELLYYSGETFFTLGYGDIVPVSGLSRLLAVCEAGMGFAFLGTIVGYLPTISSAFSRREIEISLLDGRAGSPPTAAELLGRFGKSSRRALLDHTLRDWERWSAEVLESHISYPALSFFRSQHSNQSWLGALTTILDSSSLIMASIDDFSPEQAAATFAMARHALVDLSQVVNARYDPQAVDRLPANDRARLLQSLLNCGWRLREGAEAEKKLAYLRSLYEPYAIGIARNLFIQLPPWIHTEKKKDNWQAGPWDRVIQAKGLAILGQKPELGSGQEDHF